MVGWQRDIWKAAARGLGPLAVLLLACAAQAGLEDGRYAFAQVFDVYRSPPYPVAGQSFTVQNMSRPFYSVATRPARTPYVLASDEYIRFVRVGGGDNPCKFAINRYRAGDIFIEEISGSGTVYGLAVEGFMHVSDSRDYGTFVANTSGYADGGQLTFTTPIGAATCAQAAGYAANMTPQAAPAPLLSSVGVTDVGTNSATLRGTSNSAATGYWVVVPQGDPAPSEAEIRAGQAAGGGAPAAQGSAAMTANTQRSFSAAGLTPGTAYAAYHVAYNGAASAVSGPHDFTTLAPIDGVCATVSQPVIAAPTGASACAAGTRINLTSSPGTFGWECSGLNGGATATACSAPRGYTVEPSAVTGGTVACTPANPVPYDGTVTCTASPNAGYSFGGFNACSSASGSTCTLSNIAANTVVTASFALITSHTGPSVGGTGNVTAALSGGGAACGFASASFASAASAGGTPPAGYRFPHGVLAFSTTSDCTPSGTVTLTITYPRAVPRSAKFFKYGPPTAGAASAWYEHPAVTSGNLVTYSITDNGQGDGDATAGRIADPAGVAVLASDGITAVPTLAEWALILLTGLLGLVAMRQMRLRPRSGVRRASV